MSTFVLGAPANPNQVTQGALSSQYTNWVQGQVQGAADAIAYQWFVAGGSVDLAKAIEIRDALQSGSFSVDGLFLAANGKSSLGSNLAGEPDPTLSVAGVTIDLSDFFSGTQVTEWTSGNAKNTQYHAREYFTNFDAGEAPDGWDKPEPVNEAPQVLNAVNVSATETASTYDANHEIDNQDIPDDTDPETVNLLDSAYVIDTDALSVTGITFYDSEGNEIPQPDFISWSADGTFTIEQNSPSLNGLLEGDKLLLSATYTISDSTNPDVENTINIEITGTADLYHGEGTGSNSKTYTGRDNNTGEVLTVDAGSHPEGAVDLIYTGGSITATHTGLTGNESSTIADATPADWGASIGLGKSGNQFINEVTVPLLAGALYDGQVNYNANNNSIGDSDTVTITLNYGYEYWYWA